MTFRKALFSDIDYLLWLRMETMEKYLIASGIQLSEEDHLVRVNYQFENAKILLLKEEKIGLLKMKETENGREILQLQIDPKHQGKGLGTKIIQSLITQSKQEKIQLHLSVLKNNKAKDLYERLGFRVTERTKDSFIMKI